MNSEFKFMKIEDLLRPEKGSIAMGPFGSNITVDNFVDHGVPVIQGKQLKHPFLHEVEYNFLSPQKADSLKNSKARKRDIVITHRGTIGQVGIIHDYSIYNEYIISQSQLKFSVDEQICDPYFVYYYLQSHYGQYELLKNSTSVGVPSIASPTNSVRNIKIPLPDLPIQKRISTHIKHIDYQILKIKQIQKNLREIISELFISWFIKFEPVKIMSGENVPFYMNKENANLFPKSFEDSELGLIPTGWKVGKLGDCLLTIESGKRPKGGIKEIVNGVPSIGAESIDGVGNFETSDLKYISREYFLQMKKGIVKNGDILLYKDGKYAGKVTLVDQDFPFAKCAINEHVFRLQIKENFTPQYVYSLMSSQQFHWHLEARAIKAAQPGLNRKDVETIPVLIPPQDVINEFTEKVRPLFNNIFTNAKIIQNLNQMKETIIPMLFSGKLKVN